MKFLEDDITVITKTRKFSNEAVHFPNEECETEYFGPFHDGRYTDVIGVEVYANASDKGILGCVQVDLSSFEGTIFISVRDVAGNQRFPRSFTISDESNYGYRKIINYIKRETLLGDPEELLPNDTLTLEIEIYPYFITRDDVLLNNFESVIESSLKSDRNAEGQDECHLLLDSPFADILSKESLFFQRLLDTPMLESRTRRMKIHPDHYYAFRDIAELLLCDTCFIINHTGEIFRMYVVAEKYNIPVVAETCTTFLKLCSSGENAQYLSNDIAKDDTERILLDNLMNQVYSERTEANKENLSSKQKDANSGWIYIDCYFYPEHGKTGLLFENPHKSNLYFYQ